MADSFFRRWGREDGDDKSDEIAHKALHGTGSADHAIVHAESEDESSGGEEGAAEREGGEGEKRREHSPVQHPRMPNSAAQRTFASAHTNGDKQHDARRAPHSRSPYQHASARPPSARVSNLGVRALSRKEAAAKLPGGGVGPRGIFSDKIPRFSNSRGPDSQDRVEKVGP